MTIFLPNSYQVLPKFLGNSTLVKDGKNEGKFRESFLEESSERLVGDWEESVRTYRGLREELERTYRGPREDLERT